MPIPIMPKRIRLLGATDCVAAPAGWACRKYGDAANTMPAPVERRTNSRRDISRLSIRIPLFVLKLETSLRSPLAGSVRLFRRRDDDISKRHASVLGALQV